VSFPRQQIEDAIRDEIRRATEDSPARKGAWEPEVDSQVAVRIVCRIERDFDLSLPDDCMPEGGFDGVDDCVAVLVERCREHWHETEKTRGEPVS
jgi:acyl carrier protein